MKIRVLTALVLIPPVTYLIGWAPEWLFLAVLIAVAERSIYEFVLISRQAGFRCLPGLAYSAVALLCFAQAFELRVGTGGSGGFVLLTVLFASILSVLTIASARLQELRQYPGAVASTVFGIIYIGLTLSCLVPLRFSERFSWAGSGRNLMLLLFLVIWADDIFAYITGRLLGRTLLIPRVSPKKTVEGSLGGLAGSLLVGWGFSRWFWHAANLKFVMLLILVIALSGQVGDLAESALKRGADVKDSGTLLPGHGGLLDRVDSLLFGAPALWIALSLKDFWPS
jgi:phosphatidate cytidylyltransferase